jgi:hypothetical protein
MKDYAVLDVSNEDLYLWNPAKEYPAQALFDQSIVPVGQVAFSLFGANRTEVVTLQTGEVMRSAVYSKSNASSSLEGVSLLNWERVSEFNPSDGGNSKTTTDRPSTLSQVDLKLVAVVSGPIAFVVLCVVCCIVYKRRRQKQLEREQEKLRTSQRKPFSSHKHFSLSESLEYGTCVEQEKSRNPGKRPDGLELDNSSNTYILPPPKRLVSPHSPRFSPEHDFDPYSCRSRDADSSYSQRTFYSGNRTDHSKPPLCPARGFFEEDTSQRNSSCVPHRSSHTTYNNEASPSLPSPRADNFYPKPTRKFESTAALSRTMNPTMGRTVGDYDYLYDPYRDSQLTLNRSHEDLNELLRMAEEAIEMMDPIQDMFLAPPSNLDTSTK